MVEPDDEIALLTGAILQQLVAFFPIACGDGGHEGSRRKGSGSGSGSVRDPFLISPVRRRIAVLSRAGVKAKLAIIVGICGMMGGASWYFLSRPADLPRIRLADGGEFRVVKVTYTKESSVERHEHNIGAAPEYQFALWRMLPKSAQSRVPYPHTGIGELSSTHPAISIWWAYVDPKTGKPELGPSDYVLMILDNGEERKCGWPSPSEDYRQIWGPRSTHEFQASSIQAFRP